MIKFIPKCFVFTRNRWISKNLLDYKKYNFLVEPVDLNRGYLDSNELTVMISGQLDSYVLMQLYESYEPYYTHKQILQTFRIIARFYDTIDSNMQNAFFAKQFQRMMIKFNTQIPDLNSQDLVDVLYWYKKMTIESVTSIYQLLDSAQLLGIIKQFIINDGFSPRQLLTIYECQYFWPEQGKFLNNSFSAKLYQSDVGPVQILHLFLSIQRQFDKFKTLDLDSIIGSIPQINYVLNEFDVDQKVNLYRFFLNMKLHYYVPEKQLLNIIDTLKQEAQRNLILLEQTPLINLQLTLKYIPKDQDILLYKNIKDLIINKLKEDKNSLNSDFLVEYICKIPEITLLQADEIQFLFDIVLDNVAIDLDHITIDKIGQLLCQMKMKHDKYKRIALDVINSDNYDLNEIKHIFLYLHYISQDNVAAYLTDIKNQLNVKKLVLTKQSLMSFLQLFDDYKIPLNDQFNSMVREFSPAMWIVNLTKLAYLSEGSKDRLKQACIQFTNNYKEYTRPYEFWQLIIRTIVNEDIAKIWAGWFLRLSYKAQAALLPSIITHMDGIDYSINQAGFVYMLLMQRMQYFNSEIVINWMIAGEGLLQKLVKIDPSMIQHLAKQFKFFKNGLGTAQLILLLETNFSNNTEQFKIQQLLMDSYSVQQDGYDCMLILLMIKYNCIPIDKCATICQKLTNFTSNEIRVLLLYIGLVPRLGVERLSDYISQQMKVINETYVIQIQ